MTLAEYLVAVAISTLVLAGLGGVMRLGMIAMEQGRHFETTRIQAEEVLDRIAWAIETADPKKQENFRNTKAMPEAGNRSTDRWLDIGEGSGQRTLRYDWSGKVLNEVDGAEVPRALLQFTHFNMYQTISDQTKLGTGLIRVEMTVETSQGTVKYTMLRRLGGTW